MRAPGPFSPVSPHACGGSLAIESPPSVFVTTPFISRDGVESRPEPTRFEDRSCAAEGSSRCLARPLRRARRQRCQTTAGHRTDAPTGNLESCKGFQKLLRRGVGEHLLSRATPPAQGHGRRGSIGGGQRPVPLDVGPSLLKIRWPRHLYPLLSEPNTENGRVNGAMTYGREPAGFPMQQDANGREKATTGLPAVVSEAGSSVRTGPAKSGLEVRAHYGMVARALGHPLGLGRQGGEAPSTGGSFRKPGR
jgi:hypothetical protein